MHQTATIVFHPTPTANQQNKFTRFLRQRRYENANLADASSLPRELLFWLVIFSAICLILSSSECRCLLLFQPVLSSFMPCMRSWCSLPYWSPQQLCLTNLFWYRCFYSLYHHIDFRKNLGVMLEGASSSCKTTSWMDGSMSFLYLSYEVEHLSKIFPIVAKTLLCLALSDVDL